MSVSEIAIPKIMISYIEHLLSNFLFVQSEMFVKKSRYMVRHGLRIIILDNVTSANPWCDFRIRNEALEEIKAVTNDKIP